MLDVQGAVDFIKHRFVFVINDNNLYEVYLKSTTDGFRVVIILGDDYIGKTTEFTNIKIKFEHIFADIPGLTPKVYQRTNHFTHDDACIKVWSRQSGYLIR